jgi:hypothetical protein
MNEAPAMASLMMPISRSFIRALSLSRSPSAEGSMDEAPGYGVSDDADLSFFHSLSLSFAFCRGIDE